MKWGRKMSAKLIFICRTKEEIEIFGGQVFADVDGKNVATISTESITVEVLPGTHQIKMYKSHEFGTMIGFAEVNITVSDGEALTFKYNPPMIVTQPGHITVADFVSYEKIQEEVEITSKQLASQKKESDNQKQKAEKDAKNNAWIIVLLVFAIPTIFWIIYEFMVMSILF